jgi:hypothetical protein
MRLHLPVNDNFAIGRGLVRRWLLAGVAICGLVGQASAGSILTFGGFITQSTADGTGPAVNNTGLNHILDGDAFTVKLISPSVSLAALTTYDLTGDSLTFSDPVAPASETSFDAISLTISADGIFDDFSLLGCLTTGSGCAFGNQLDANFKILATDLTSAGAGAIGLDQPHPLDLLEDDGITDIQGSISSYSNSTVPEPDLAAEVGCLLAGLAAARSALARRRGSKS